MGALKSKEAFTKKVTQQQKDVPADELWKQCSKSILDAVRRLTEKTTLPATKHETQET